MNQKNRFDFNLLQKFAIAMTAIVGAGGSAQAQGDTEEVIVEATRVEERVTDIPAAVGVLTQDDVQLARQQLGLDESLFKIPGLFLQNRYNFAQDLRIAIRGFGARGNFGIRGVKILVDDIPSTLPDGQGQVDSIDLGSAGQVDVIRGAASSLYGNASGGVINIRTEAGPEIPFVEGRVSLGDFDYAKTQLKAGGDTGRWNYLLSASNLELDGFRDHSRVENRTFNSRLTYAIDEQSELTTVINFFDSPQSDDPGGITAEQAAADPTQARDLNVQFNAGEEIDQQKIGFVYRRQLADNHQIIARNYYLWRDFANLLPFTSGGAVVFDRFFYGGGLQYVYTGDVIGHANRLAIGFDVDFQEDDRERFDNNNGVIGTQVFDQQEDVTSYGIFVQNEFALTDAVELTVGGRLDRVEFDVADRFLADGDDSGSRDIDEFSPMAGLLWRVSDEHNLYANISTAFETPTTTEFANPAGGGFNPDLDPQTATNYEVGAKGQLRDGLIRYELALFLIEVEDELVAFELPQFPGRTFFENAGKSDRRGIEAGIMLRPARGLTATFAYTYSDFEFDEFTSDGDSFAGNQIPGIPENQFTAEVAYYHPSGLFAIGDVLYVDEFFANNSNAVKTDAYTVANARVGFQKIMGRWELTPFVGVNNAFDEEYNANVRINAFGGRFFEPAPDRNFYGGFTARYNFET